MQSPAETEAGDEVLQVLEVCEPVEEIKEVIVTTGEGDGYTPPAATTSQVRRSLANMRSAAY